MRTRAGGTTCGVDREKSHRDLLREDKGDRDAHRALRAVLMGGGYRESKERSRMKANDGSFDRSGHGWLNWLEVGGSEATIPDRSALHPYYREVIEEGIIGSEICFAGADRADTMDASDLGGMVGVRTSRRLRNVTSVTVSVAGSAGTSASE